MNELAIFLLLFILIFNDEISDLFKAYIDYLNRKGSKTE
jgi:hypothetical protein